MQISARNERARPPGGSNDDHGYGARLRRQLADHRRADVAPVSGDVRDEPERQTLIPDPVNTE